VAAAGEGPSCDRLSGSHNEPALTRELPPVEVAEALDLGKADIFEQASELGRGIDAEPERDGAARSVGRASMCSVSTSPAWRSRVGLNNPCPLGVKKLECHHR
jgi:hypothetical protein